MENQLSIPTEDIPSEIGNDLNRAHNSALALARTGSSRELSIVLTKIEEAQLWLSKIIKKD